MYIYLKSLINRSHLSRLVSAVDLFQTLLVSKYILLMSSGIVSDPQEGILIESFDYRTPNGLHFTVLSDSQESTNELQDLFRKASSIAKMAKLKSKQSAIT